MKVLFLARYLPQEGSTTHMYTLAKGLIDRGHEVHMISAGPKEDESAIKIFNETIEYGMKHHKVGFPLKPSFNLLGKVKQLIEYMLTTPKALYMIFKISPDIIHVHYPVTSYIAKIYCKLNRKKFITTHHITGIPKHPLHKKANYVVAISRELQDELENKFKYDNNQVKLIFNGVSESKFNKEITKEQKMNIKKELGISEDDIIIGFVGSLNKRKGIDILLEACSYIKNRNIKIILVGDGDVDWVRSLITKFELNSITSIYKFQDPQKFYSIFDIFVLPSRQEGFPLVPLEAMMMGVPTIRSNVEGAYDQIINGENGFIFENENSEELSEYIVKLINNKLLRKKMSERANKKAIELFSEKVMMDNLIDLYKECISG